MHPVRRPLMPFLRAPLFAALTFLTVASGPAAETPSQISRNVLLLISDDQGLDLGCYGSRAVTTPRIDRLAGEGARFTHAFAAVSSCSPSRATLLTGMYNHSNGQYGLSHGAHHQRTHEDLRSLPSILKEKGYRTGILGKTHIAPESVYPFDVHKAGNQNRNPAALRRHTREFIQSAAGAPFFLTVGFGDPHRAGSRFPPAAGDTGTTGAAVSGDVPLPAYLTDLPGVRQDYADYCARVNVLDQCVGEVLNALEECGATTSTLVIYVSDNGIPFPGAKTNLYDAGIHLPLILRAPGTAQSGTTCDAMVSWVDIAPTVLDWAGVSQRFRMQGSSLLPLLADPKSGNRERIFASHTFHEITMYYPMRCVRDRRYKLIWNLAHELPYPISGDITRSPSWLAMSGPEGGRVGQRSVQQYLQRPEFELYDLEKDPAEGRNLAGAEEHRETLARLKGELVKMMRDTKDPWLKSAGGGEGETGAE